MSIAFLPNIRIYGYTGVRQLPNFEHFEDRYGLVTATLEFEGQAQDLYAQTPKPGSAHPLAPHLICEERTIRGGGVWARATLKYCGMQPDKGDESDAVYSLRFGTSAEPIELHPDFKDTIGGTPSNPRNGAIFMDSEGNITDDDATGYFERFALYVSGTKNPFAGISTYLDTGEIIWSKRYTKRTAPSMSNILEIDTPDGDYPNLGEGRNWIKLPPQYEKRARVYTVEEQWRASGRGGANATIYGGS